MFASYFAEKETIGFLFSPKCTDLYMCWLKESLPVEAFLEPTFRTIRAVLDEIPVFSGGFQDIAVLKAKANILKMEIDISSVALAMDYQSYSERSAIECAKVVLREHRIREKKNALKTLAKKAEELTTEKEKTDWELTTPARITELFSDCQSDPVSASALAEELLVTLELENSGRTSVISTGFYSIDQMIKGVKPGQLVTIGGRPSMGKTAFATNLMLNMSTKGKNCLYFSLEMIRVDLLARLASSLSGLSMDSLALNFNSAYESIIKISKMPFWIEDKAGISIESICAESRKHKAMHGLDVIFIDYIQLVSVTGYFESEAKRIGTISKALKNISKDLEIPVILLSQLNRECEKRNNREPMLSDLKSSGDIEQDSDVIMLIYRPGYYDKKEDPTIAEIIVAKNRNGPTGKATLGTELKCNNFFERKMI